MIGGNFGIGFLFLVYRIQLFKLKNLIIISGAKAHECRIFSGRHGGTLIMLGIRYYTATQRTVKTHVLAA
jgi:hypothetical protein